VLEEIEEITNPKVKAGKKALTQEQNQLKASVLAVLDGVRDESSKDAAGAPGVRAQDQPHRPGRADHRAAGPHQPGTSSPSTSPWWAGRAAGAEVPAPDAAGVDRLPPADHGRGAQHRLRKVLERIHILEGRQLVLLNIDEVIAIIRGSDEPKAALIARFKLSERQAEDILEIRLRQLARLEAIKIEQELSALRDEQKKLEDILGSPAALRRLMVKEIEADAKQFADARRTLIQAEKKAVAEVKVVDEPVTVVVSQKGWVRARSGHGHDAASFAFKAGDGLYGTFECRTVDTLLVWQQRARVLGAGGHLPGARGDGQPLTTLIELEAGTQPAALLCRPANAPGCC
jgi:topoisomerase-4 subunit A